MDPTIVFFLLAVLFQAKHLLADFFWQGKYMLGKFNITGWVAPLGAHCLVHMVFTFLIVAIVTSNPLLSFGLALFDFGTHFIIDRTKVTSVRGLTPHDAKFWHYLGCDQFLHHVIHYFIILAIIMV